MQLLVISQSNIKFIPSLIMAGVVSKEHKRIVVDLPPIKDKYKQSNNVVAVGGGAVIDTAKLMSKDHPIVAVPTTAAGAACTSHAVLWDEGNHVSVQCKKPILNCAYIWMDIKLSDQVIKETQMDCFCHILESFFSLKATPASHQHCIEAVNNLAGFIENKRITSLIEAGNDAGKAIEITGTNYYHALSYVAKDIYKCSHGEALRKIFFDSAPSALSILKQAKQYKKLKEGIMYYL